MISRIHDLADGSLIMLPSSVHDWDFVPDGNVKLRKAAWDAIGSEFASRHMQHEMFYAGARFVTTGHSYRTFDWNAARGMVDRLLSGYDR